MTLTISCVHVKILTVLLSENKSNSVIVVMVISNGNHINLT